MTLLDEPRSRPAPASREARSGQDPTSADDEVIDLTHDQEHAAAGARSRAEPRPGVPRIDPTGRIAYRGMRIRRVRLGSVAKIAAVFWGLAYGVLLGTVVVVWDVADRLGYIDSFEQTLITSLGLESFEIDGGGMFGLVAGAFGFVCLLGWLGTLAAAAIYNACCGAFGGLALETGPIQRRRRVFSWRHRGFVTVSR